MVLVFKTSVKTEEDVLQLKSKINGLGTNINHNFDLADCDNILRIQSSEVTSDQVIDLLEKNHYECRELE